MILCFRSPLMMIPVVKNKKKSSISKELTSPNKWQFFLRILNHYEVCVIVSNAYTNIVQTRTSSQAIYYNMYLTSNLRQLTLITILLVTYLGSQL